MKPVSFGADGYTDYIMRPHDKEKQEYISRQRANENWNDKMRART